MKFKDSRLEERYNVMWNKFAVPADVQIRQLFGAKGFFSEQQPNYYQLLSNYTHAAKNIVANLRRQSSMFEDQDYVNDYLISTLSSIYNDFSQYRPRLSGRYDVQSDCVKLIDETMEWAKSFGFDMEKTIESDEDSALHFTY